MTDQTIDMLLGIREQTSRYILNYLGSVIEWSSGQEARILHASFADYLTDPARSGGQPWTIDTRIRQKSLSLGCLRILNSELQFDICGIDNSHLLDADVPDMSYRVAAIISPQLSYSSCFWFNHIREAPFDETILTAIDKLCHVTIVYWLEVLSLLGQIPIASAALEVAGNYIEVSSHLYIYLTHLHSGKHNNASERELDSCKCSQ